MVSCEWLVVSGVEGRYRRPSAGADEDWGEVD